MTDRWPQNDSDFDPVLPPLDAEFRANPVRIIGRSISDPDHLYVEHPDGFASLVVRQTVSVVRRDLSNLGIAISVPFPPNE